MIRRQNRRDTLGEMSYGTALTDGLLMMFPDYDQGNERVGHLPMSVFCGLPQSQIEQDQLINTYLKEI